MLLSQRKMVYAGGASFYYMMSHQMILRYLGGIADIFHLQSRVLLLPWIVLSLTIMFVSKPMVDSFIGLLKRKCKR